MGYTGGTNSRPSYQSVCAGDGHTEAIEVEYDPEQVSYDELLDNFFAMHWPMPTNTQYKSAIWFHSEDQKASAERVLKQQGARDAELPKCVEVAEVRDFHDAEDYHQKYYKKKMANMPSFFSSDTL